MRLGREMDDCVDPMLHDHMIDEFLVANIPMDEDMPIGSRQVLQVCRRAGICEGVQVDHPDILSGLEQVADKVASDEARSACDQYVLHIFAACL